MPALLMAVTVLGCAAKPPERPIVLRPHHPERKIVRHHQPSHAAESAAEEPLHPTEPAWSAETAEPPLSPAEKQRLFQDFQSYLARTGQAP